MAENKYFLQAIFDEINDKNLNLIYSNCIRYKYYQACLVVKNIGYRYSGDIFSFGYENPLIHRIIRNKNAVETLYKNGSKLTVLTDKYNGRCKRFNAILHESDVSDESLDLVFKRTLKHYYLGDITNADTE